MQLDTARFGRLEVNEDDVIVFPVGIPGFPDVHKYVILEHSDEGIFHILQGVDDPDVAFILIDPRTFVPDYKAEVARDEIGELQLEADDEAAVLTIVTVPQGDPSAMTTNLQAPIVFNPRTRIGRQVLLMDSPYSIRHPLLTTEQTDADDEAQSSREAG